MQEEFARHLRQMEACGKIIYMKRPKFSWKYAAIVVSVVLLAYLVMDFNNRMSNLRSLSAEKERVGAQVTALEGDHNKLETQIAHATSESAAVEWAYEDGRLVQAGDHPVIPLAPAESTPVPTSTPVVTRPLVDNWQVWMWLFFDKTGN
jgi:hypothetical protein